MKNLMRLMTVGLLTLSVLASAAGNTRELANAAPATRVLTEADRKVEAGRLLLKWGGYVEKVEGQDRQAWAARLWPSLASADLGNLQKASRAVTYEGMRNALLGQRPYDEEVIDRMAKAGTVGNPVSKALGSLASDLVFTPITPCRIVDTRVSVGRLAANGTRNLIASNPAGTFAGQGGSNTNCGIPANPAALALSVTALGNTATGFLRVFPANGTSAQGSPVSMTRVNTTVNNDIVVAACQACASDLKVFTSASTHYAAFVTGYFMAPQATALACVEAMGEPVTISPGNFSELPVAQCPAAYARTGIHLATDSEKVVQGFFFGDARRLTVFNRGAGTASVRELSICCGVPGR